MMFIDMSGYTPPGMKTDKTFRLPVLCLVLIMLLNDGCILTIAYDKVWNIPGGSSGQLLENTQEYIIGNI